MTSVDALAAPLTMQAAETETSEALHRAKTFPTVLVHKQAVPIAVRRQTASRLHTKLPQPALGRCPGTEASSSPALSFRCCAGACWESRVHCRPEKASLALEVGTCVPAYTWLTGQHDLQNRLRAEWKRWPKRSARAGLTEGKTLQSWHRGGGPPPPPSPASKETKSVHSCTVLRLAGGGGGGACPPALCVIKNLFVPRKLRIM
jgi:hypothetical protein